MAARKIWIIGAGGFGAEILGTLRGSWRPDFSDSCEVAFAVDSPPRADFMGLPVHSLDAIAEGDEFTLAIGAGSARQRIHAEMLARGACPFTVLAPTAIVGLGVTMGDGCVLSDFTILTGNLAIGQQFQCNIFSYVAHDCRIGDYVTFAPKVCCNGNVHIGDHAYIGTGAVGRRLAAELRAELRHATDHLM